MVRYWILASLTSVTKQWCPLSFLFSTEGLGASIIPEKEIKDTQFDKEKKPNSLFSEDRIVYVGNLKESTRIPETNKQV